MAIKLNDIVYRADVVRDEYSPKDSQPYIESLTIAKITTVERAEGLEISFSSQEHGKESGSVWYEVDDIRGIKYEYKILPTKAQAILVAKQFYKELTGVDFVGTVIEK